MTIVGVKHEVVKYSYDVEYDISVDQAMPQSRAAIDAPYGYMRCTQLTIHLKPKHREPEGNVIAGLILPSNASKCTGHCKYSKPIDAPDCTLCGRQGTLAAQRQAADVDRIGIPKYDPYTIE